MGTAQIHTRAPLLLLGRTRFPRASKEDIWSLKTVILLIVLLRKVRMERDFT